MLRVFRILFIVFISISPAYSATWDGGGSDNLASDAANWSEVTVPPQGDTIIFDSTSSKDCTWDLPETFFFLHIEGGYTGTATLFSLLTLSSICPSGLTNCGDTCYMPDSACGTCNQGTTVCSGGAIICQNADQGLTTYYGDADSDGYGNSNVSTQTCSQPAGYVTNNTDCNDSYAVVHPGAPEVCNGIDDNCNGAADEGNPGGDVPCGACNQGTTVCSGGAIICQNADQGLATYYRDADSDGYGDPNVSTQACSQPPAYVTNSTDCDDTDANVHPGTGGCL